MPSCKEIAERASALIDGDLSSWEVFRIRIHLAMCKGCAQFIAQLRATDRLIAQVAERDGPPVQASGDARFADVLSALRKPHKRP